MEIFTIGFTQKTAEQFFEIIKKTGTKLLIDVRLNNQSQLAGFTKGKDIIYFLKQICNCDYRHELKFAPSKELLNNYKKEKITWNQYEIEYQNQFKKNNMTDIFKSRYMKEDSIIFLCSEATPENCHRRLLAEKLQDALSDIRIVHL